MQCTKTFPFREWLIDRNTLVGQCLGNVRQAALQRNLRQSASNGCKTSLSSPAHRARPQQTTSRFLDRRSSNFQTILARSKSTTEFVDSLSRDSLVSKK